jgi:RNA polymerase sigma-70 factor (ECF subfamily)
MVAIARNRAIDEIRRRPIVETAAPIEDAGDIRDPAALALDGLEQQEGARRLADCLAGLETDRREMVRLAYLEGWSREALSQRFEAPVATVKTWLHRSLRQLKDCLER